MFASGQAASLSILMHYHPKRVAIAGGLLYFFINGDGDGNDDA